MFNSCIVYVIIVHNKFGVLTTVFVYVTLKTYK